MIKSILVNLSVGATRVAAMDYAISVAGAFEAHLMGTAFAYEPILPPTIMGGIPSDFIQAQREESEKAATETIKAFEERTRRAGISAESTMIVATLAEAADRFGKLARRADLSIVEQTNPDALATEDLIIEAALFQSGRPVIIVPYIQKSGLSLNHVMIAWDGSRNAARAIGDAMPFLHQAKAIEIVIVATDQEFGELPGADLAQHLARHGLKIDLRRIVAAKSSVSSTLLSHAADVSADLLVMGGFGHSRFREFFFGGTTRGILDTMTLPVLMSH